MELIYKHIVLDSHTTEYNMVKIMKDMKKFEDSSTYLNREFKKTFTKNRGERIRYDSDLPSFLNFLCKSFFLFFFLEILLCVSRCVLLRFFFVWNWELSREENLVKMNWRVKSVWLEGLSQPFRASIDEALTIMVEELWWGEVREESERVTKRDE